VARWRRRAQRWLVAEREREEAVLEHRLRGHPGVTRPNSLALISPKGGVGKTTATFLVGNLLASHLNLRAIAIDANPDFGTLARLAPDGRRSPRSLFDVLEDAGRLRTAAELTPYVSRLPTGLHLLGAPPDAELSARLGANAYGELVALLSTFYDVVLLDLGTGVVGPLVRFVTERADRVVLVTTPEWITASVVLEALAHLRHDHATVAINKSLAHPSDRSVIEDRFRAQHLHQAVTIPYDEALATMLDTGTYSLEALRDRTRIAVKRLGLAVAEQLV
jgi:MinD-like ATPase involved in chromosome partitioning or flagellar assembly